MAYDFRANQVRLNRIISSGSIPIIIYPSSSAADFAGNLVPSFSTAAIGSDVFLYVSGSETAKTVFGGGVVISGSLVNGLAATCVASGVGSHAEGSQTTASGDYSHAEGQNNVASGWRSHAEGYGTSATAYNAHSEGENTIAGGYGSHAEGVYSEAKGNWSHAEGDSTITYNGANSSHAEGYKTTTYGFWSHAEGYQAKAYGTGSHAGGLYTEAYGSIDGVDPPANVQTVFGKYNVRNNYDSLFVIGNGTGDGDPQRSDILRVNSGSVEITGSLAVVSGITGSISGTIGGLPFILAGPNITTNYNSLGQWTITGSAAGGSSLWTELNASTIYTTSSILVGQLSASLGAIITGSLLQGAPLNVGLNAHAEGDSTQALADYSHAEGSNTTVALTANNAHAEGSHTNAAGPYSHAEGVQTHTTFPAHGSHAEGFDTYTTGPYSHAEGSGSVTIGIASHAGGLHTTAAGDYQTVFGKYNDKTNISSLFVIGDGLDSVNLHDVLRVESGSVQVTGSLEVNGGITGSIRYVTGTTHYLIGNGVTVNYNSSGQYELSASGGTISNSTTVTGDGTNRGSGSIGGLFGLSAGQIGKYEVQVVAVDSGGTNSATWNFSVSGFYPTAGSFSFLGINELTFDHSTSAASWDVNFNDSGQIEVTGSTGGTFFYTQVTAKMIAVYNSIVF